MKFKYIFLVLFALSGCKKALDIGPSPVSLTGDNVYTNNGSAQAVLAGLFSKMAGTGNLSNGPSSLSLLMGLSADELSNFSASSITFGQYYGNNLNNESPGPWSELYSEIYVCNTAIKGLSDESTAVSPSVRQQLLGELKFVRGFLYFYAVNLYGDVPLLLTNDYKLNNVASKTPEAQVYQQIVKDLKEAQSALSDNKYVTAAGVEATDRVRPNKQAATALLARAYLYLQDWKNAEEQATAVINSTAYRLENLSQVFLKTSKETIWQLQSVVSGYNNADAVYLVVTNTPGGGSFGGGNQLPLNSPLVEAFERTDPRFTSWIGQFNAPATPTTPAKIYYYANKYKVFTSQATSITENPIVLRLAEQYLIRAEARVQQDNLAGSKRDLNTIRNRAVAGETNAVSKAELLTAIAKERQIELFSEWGHRWFDLKRTGKIDEVMNAVSAIKGSVWNANKQLLPLPIGDILANTNLIQNPGY